MPSLGRREWLAASSGNKKRQEQIRLFMQMAAEYWHSTQPSRSNRQWELMAEVVSPSQLSDGQMELIQLIS